MIIAYLSGVEKVFANDPLKTVGRLLFFIK